MITRAYFLHLNCSKIAPDPIEEAHRALSDPLVDLGKGKGRVRRGGLEKERDGGEGGMGRG
jgi:hypothetical protein